MILRTYPGQSTIGVITRVFCYIFLTPALGAGVIVVACTVRAAAAAGINLVGVPQTKPMQ